MLTAIQNKKSSIATALFAALLLTCTPAVIAHTPACPTGDTVVTVPTTTVKSDSYLTLGNAAWVTFFLMLARLWTREGSNAPVQYNLDELALLENIPNNLYYLVDDGIIGHFGKKPYLTVDMDNSRVEVALADKTDENGNVIKDAQGNKIKVSTAVWPKGLMGWAAFYIKPLICAAGVSVFIKALFDAKKAMLPNEPYITAFKRTIEKSYGFTIGKWVDYGTNASLTAVSTVLPN
jgi:hypothetical protein